MGQRVRINSMGKVIYSRLLLIQFCHRAIMRISLHSSESVSEKNSLNTYVIICMACSKHVKDCYLYHRSSDI